MGAAADEKDSALALPGTVWALIGACVLVELVLLGADWRLWGSPVWRGMAYGYGGFWAGLLRDWVPNYPGQRVLMFGTYSLLHAGPGHLMGNVLVIALLGRTVWRRIGSRRLLAVWALAVMAGAGTFGLLSDAPAPMVGASGGVFGLAGAAVALYWEDRRSWRGLGGVLGALVALNFATWALSDGQMAWETHLGGFLAGALALRASQPRVP
ncbi:rhomboid family intramembrane serine protease [Rubellimicrobium roseum]|uniref:Rhomboid family intramembrane serine protease n=2 Tax=Rubellimicrobium roseum TaxID=687525 RepID=A0A5C4NM05_9RHOB|nr:rhomboid family intramembrane serine protease [Rubellimicrobium roseum]